MSVNEDTTNAFLTCGFPEDGVQSVTAGIGVAAQNLGGAAQTLTCTAVDDRSPARYSTKTITLLAGVTASIDWAAGDNGGDPYLEPSISCAVPPNTKFFKTNRVRVFNQEKPCRLGG